MFKLIFAVIAIGTASWASSFDTLGTAFEKAGLPQAEEIPADSFWGGKCVFVDQPDRFYPAYFLFYRTTVVGDPIFGGQHSYLMPFFNRTEGQDDPERYLNPSLEFAKYTLDHARPLIGSAYSPLTLFPDLEPTEWRSLYRMKQPDGKIRHGDYRLKVSYDHENPTWIVRVDGGHVIPSGTYAYCYAWVKRQ